MVPTPLADNFERHAMNNSCPNCGTVYNITPQLIGKSTTCKKCGAALVIDASGLQLAGGQRPGSQFDFQPVPRGPSWFGELIAFRIMITPFFIKYILFWLLVVGFLVTGILIMVSGARFGGGFAVLMGLVPLLLGPVFARFYCEILLVVFQINDSLKDIKKDLQKK
jgi:hypothetical protein